MRRLDISRTADPAGMMAGDDIAVETEAGHQQEAPARGVTQIGAEHPSGGDVASQGGGTPPQSEMLGGQILGSRRQHGNGYLGLLIDQGSDRTIAPHGHQAAAPRTRLRLGDEHLPLGGSPGDLGREAEFSELAHQASNEDVVAAGARTPIGNNSHPGSTACRRRTPRASVDMPVELVSRLAIPESRRDITWVGWFHS